MRIGRFLTVTEINTDITTYLKTIIHDVDVQKTILLNTDSTLGHLAELIGIDDVKVPVTYLQAGSQVIPTSDWTAISWDTEIIDNLECFDAGTPTYITLPCDGIYHLVFYVVWNGNVNGVRKAWLSGILLPELYDEKEIDSVDVSSQTLSGDCFVYCLNTIMPKIWQNTGGNLNLYSADLLVYRKAIIEYPIEF